MTKSFPILYSATTASTAGTASLGLSVCIKTSTDRQRHRRSARQKHRHGETRKQTITDERRVLQS